MDIGTATNQHGESAVLAYAYSKNGAQYKEAVFMLSNGKSRFYINKDGKEVDPLQECFVAVSGVIKHHDKDAISTNKDDVEMVRNTLSEFASLGYKTDENSKLFRIGKFSLMPGFDDKHAVLDSCYDKIAHGIISRTHN
jgi:hypothetical protein